MTRILDLFIPKTRLQGAAAFAALLGLVLLAHLAATERLSGLQDRSDHLAILPTVMIDAPLIALLLGIILYQSRQRAHLSVLSHKDALTGLNNRRAFLSQTEKRHGHETGVLLMLDADNFKSINDQYGHVTGDACLKSIADSLSKNVRRTDIVGRLGGEEFAIFLSGVDLEQARAIATRICKPVTFFATGSDRPLTITLSVGAVAFASSETLEAMLDRADKALYAAKKQGRARLVFWEPSLESGTHAVPA